jgi:hypothetical protein
MDPGWQSLLQNSYLFHCKILEVMTLQVFSIVEMHVRASDAIVDYQGLILIRLRTSLWYKIRNSIRIFYKKQDLKENSSGDLQRHHRTSKEFNEHQKKSLDFKAADASRVYRECGAINYL